MERSALEGRVALVTGASGGIGQALSRRLAAGGAAVALGYAANPGPARELADDISKGGGKAIAIGADLREPAAPGRLAADAEEALGPVDVLVSNAGLARPQSLAEVRSEDFDEVLAVNLRAPFLLAQRLVPAMGERGFGRVLFVSSVAAFTGGIVGPHYTASKAGLHGLVHYFASRFAAHGVTVNALAPALVTGTGMFPDQTGELRRLVPVGRLGQPGEVADLAIAILGNPYVTSQVISADGGMYPR